MKLIKKFIPDGVKCDTKEKFPKGQPTSITIHWTGPYPGQSPDVVRDWWINSNGEASAHYIIKDDECMQCWPDDKVAWHTGKRVGNYTSIGIEIIPESKDGKFSDKSIETARELIATIGGDKDILRHFDWNGKDCPKYYLAGDRWSELYKKLKGLL